MVLNSEIHVWVISHDIQVPYEHMQLALSAEERRKANVFIFEKDKINFVKTRFFIRLAMSHYLHLELKDISFVYNKHGKPHINEDISNIPIRFSISHSNECIVFAFQQNQEIGVDIEYIDHNKIDDLIEDDSIFNLEELKLLKSQPLHYRDKLFYKLWTCKESCIKALGIGLNIPLTQVKIAIDLSSASYNHCSGKIYDRYEQRIYYLVDARNLPDNYVGTIALQSNDATIKYVDQNMIETLLAQFRHKCL